MRSEIIKKLPCIHLKERLNLQTLMSSISSEKVKSPCRNEVNIKQIQSICDAINGDQSALLDTHG